MFTSRPRIAVIGTGAMGINHARICAEFGILSGIYDNNPATANRVADLYHTKTYLSMGELLHDCEAAIIAVPTPYHEAVAIQCMEGGLDILLEKPISDGLESAQRILDCATQTGRLLATGYTMRFEPVSAGLLSLVKSGYFGEITSVNCKRVGGIPRTANNIILDLMTHDFNYLMRLFGTEPTHIYTHKMIHDGILDSAQTLLSFGSSSASCESNWIAPIKVRRIEVTGTEGYVIVDTIAGTLTEMRKDLQLVHQYHGEPLKEEIMAFVEAIESRLETGIVTGIDAYKTLEITLRAYNFGGNVDNG